MLEEYSADDLTVKMFCIESGLSKQTLYNHYYCLMDAVDDAYQSELKEAMGDSVVYTDWVAGFRKLLLHLHARKREYLHIYYSSRRDELIGMIARHGIGLIEQGIRDCARDKGYSVSDREMRFMRRFYMNVFMGIIKDYLDGRMEDDPEYLASMCDAMMRYHIQSTLANLAAMKKGEF